MLLILAATTVAADEFPLRVSANGRYLEDNRGEPFLMVGDAAWSLTTQLTYRQADIYLTDRANRGFNVVIVNLIEHRFAFSAPNNTYNVSPFTGRCFATPNPAYFALADSMIDRAGELGIAVLLAPMYIGAGCTPKAGSGRDGFCAEIRGAKSADIRAWGEWLGEHYRGGKNIIWLIGGDQDPRDAQLSDKIDTLVMALKATDTNSARLYTAHGDDVKPIDEQFPGNWIDLRGIYTYRELENVTLTTAAYALETVRPVFQIEGLYENGEWGLHRWSDLRHHKQVWWPAMRGAVGAIMGNCPIWWFGYDLCELRPPGDQYNWRASLRSRSSMAMSVFKSVMTQRHWWTLVPDLTGKVLTAGEGSADDPATLAYAADSSGILGYVPTQRSITISPSCVKGDSVLVTWINPGSGMSSKTVRSRKVVQTITPPFEGDWVLAVDCLSPDSVLSSSAR